MFKTAAAKIAHNSTLPALGGNQDLRPLQDLITAEKAVLISLQKLSVDYSKASEALRTWGLNEGDDLGDILSASTTVLNHFSSALSQYASHGHVMRDQLKAIRTREEALEDLKRRRRAVHKKAEDADKKLSKMSPEHKNLGMQTELLNRLRDEIRTMDSDIMTEEAALGDFKRTATRMWMGLKFGGLLECCEKGTVVAEFGKMIIAEISEDITQPGLPRSMYYGHGKTENFVAEAHRCINEIALSTVPSVGFRDRRAYTQSQDSQQISYQPQPESYGPGSAPFTPTDYKPQPLPPRMSNENYSQRPYPDEKASPLVTTAPPFTYQQQPYAPQYQQQSSTSGYSQTLPPLNTGGNLEQPQTMDDFGMNTRSAGLPNNSNASAGRFATFPVKTRPLGVPGGYSSQEPPSLGAREEDKSLSASIAEALSDGGSEETAQADGIHGKASSKWGGSTFGTEETTRAVESVQIPPPQQPWTGPTGVPPVQYQPPSGPPPVVQTTAPLNINSSSSLPPPPPGAAPPDLSSPWTSGNPQGSVQAASHTRSFSDISGNDDALLAYMTSAVVDEDSRPEKLHLEANEEDQQRISRHVRFGEVQDVNSETEKRESSEKERSINEPIVNSIVSTSPPESTQVSNLTQITSVGQDGKSDLGDGLSNSSSSDTNSKPKHYRVPPPTFNPEEDEASLNAAAAREVSRELEALKISPPAPSAIDERPQTEPTIDRGRLPVIPNPYGEQPSQGSVAPLQAQSMSTANRNVSPHPYAELNANAPTPYASQSGPYSPASQSYGPSYSTPSPAQAYAQAYQASSNYPSSSPDAHVTTSNIPPRFQALNQSKEMQIPPRFQTAAANQLPPRFQTGGPSQISSTINQEPQDSSRLALLQGPESPYLTPPEYPRALGSNSSFTRSNPSLNASPGLGGRTISAAAFKRPRNASVERAGDPFAKKTLPGSPYPAREPFGTATSSVVAPPPAGAARPKSEFEDDEYDYISAYVNNSNPSSPQKAEFGGGANDGGRPGGGYNDGRFATNLDNGSLR